MVKLKKFGAVVALIVGSSLFVSAQAQVPNSLQGPANTNTPGNAATSVIPNSLEGPANTNTPGNAATYVIPNSLAGPANTNTPGNAADTKLPIPPAQK